MENALRVYLPAARSKISRGAEEMVHAPSKMGFSRLARFAPVGQIVVIDARPDPGQPEDQFRRKQFITESALRFQHSAVATAPRTSHRTAQ